jgi:putative heme-binding domain-containing protein
MLSRCRLLIYSFQIYVRKNVPMIWWAMALLFMQQTFERPATDTNPYTSPADIERGKQIFEARCAGCHGPGGSGGKGANLAVPVLPRASTDLSLWRIVRYGIPDTEMPQTALTHLETWQVAAFVRSLGRVGNEPVSGNASRGRELVAGKGGCLGCHSIGLEGGHMGPALTDIGARRSPAYLRAKLLDPATDTPDQFRMVRLKTRAGETVTGVRLNEDAFSIQLRDSHDALRSFWKQDLAEFKTERRTPMPSYRGRLDAKELDDMIAYLSGLRGNQ